MREDVDLFVPIVPKKCTSCGLSLKDREKIFYKCRQEIDIPPLKSIVTQYDSYTIECNCGIDNIGSFPERLKAKVQYGPRVRSLINYMSVYQLLPLKRMREYFKAAYDLSISEGTFVNTIKRTAKLTNGIYETIKDYLAQSRVVGTDETVIWSNNKKWYNWVWQNGKATFIVCEPTRRKDVIYKYFPHGFPNSILISDRYAAHLSTPSLGAQICWPHLLRKLKQLNESEDNPWINKLRNIYLRGKYLKAKRTKWNRTGKKVKALEADLTAILLEEIDSNYKDTKTLQESLKLNRHAILTFLYHAEVTADNNASERAIRNSKVKMKISGQFKSLQKEYANIRSIIDTLVKNKRPIFETLYSIEIGEDIKLGWSAPE